MKKKNLIFILIDSFSNKNIDSLGIDCMPFLSELKKKSIYYPNMYSEAPYTEAAMISLLCGVDTLHNGGYFYRYKDNKTIMDYFHESGYDVINYLQPHVYPKAVLRGSTFPFYNVCFDFNVLWEYRLSFYSKRLTKVAIPNEDIIKLKELMDENFYEWINFFSLYLNRDDSMSLIIKNIDDSIPCGMVEGGLKIIKQEFEKYSNGKSAYIINLLNVNHEHILFQVPVLNQTNKMKNCTKLWLQKNYEKLFEDIYRKNRKMNKRISKISFNSIKFDLKRAIKSRNKSDIESILRYFKYFRDTYNDADIMARVSNDLDNFKSAPSAHSHFTHFLDWLNHSKSKKPYFSYIHVDDIHNPEVFFTYDSDDKELLKEEFTLIQDIFEKIPESNTGSVSYFLSLAYIDLKLKKFIESLEQQGELENTQIVITGDHGFSFDNIIPRNSRVNNFYLENYNVPFILYDYGIDAFTSKNQCSSIDILPTILESFNIPIKNEIQGISLLNEIESRTISMQYMGGGCPDIDKRDAYITLHNDKWLIVAKSNISTEFRKISYCEIYNLIEDPNQLKNLLYNNIQNPDLTALMEDLSRRFKALYNNYRNLKRK